MAVVQVLEAVLVLTVVLVLVLVLMVVVAATVVMVVGSQMAQSIPESIILEKYIVMAHLRE